MAQHRLGIIMNGVTGRMGMNQHLIRSILAIRAQGGVALKNGGELITLPPAEAKRYLDVVAPVATSVLSVNPQVKDDYEALLAAAKKYRQ